MTTPAELNWIELSRTALRNNIKSLAKLAAKSQLAVCVKSNAYGHGLAEMVQLLSEMKEVACLTCHSVEEAATCRIEGWDRQIILLGPTANYEIPAVLEYDLEPVVFTLESLRALGKAAAKVETPVRTHLKLETGTNRQGITEQELPKYAEVYKKFAYLRRPYGASTHFANIEDTTSHEYAQLQLDRFNGMIRKMTSLGIKPKIRHTACSAAHILFGKTHFELVRPGISVYGYWPSKETYLSYRLSGGKNDIFRPILSWRTRLTQLKKVPADSFIGYGCTYRTTSATRLGILPIGYFDGYARSLSNLAYVLVDGRRASVRGRVCMNLTMVDVTDIKGVKLGDPVTLLGESGSESLTADRLAGWAGTIHYEILARLSPMTPRVVTD